MKLKKSATRAIRILSALVLFFVLTTSFVMIHSKFGKRPSGRRLDLIKSSPNFRDGKFQNIHYTPTLTEGYGLTSSLYEFLFKASKDSKPKTEIPSVNTDWRNIDIHEDILIWLGHSSYFIQIDGKRILVDPVLSNHASPIPWGGQPFKGTQICTAEELPAIDYVFISHDHYDHLDDATLKKILPKTSKIICGLGVGAHLESWGYPLGKIIEKDWNEKIDLGDGFIIYTTPARHFSGRSFSSNNTLWMSYVLQTPSVKLYLGGDSGYDTHFANIGSKYGPFDLVILENGQYDPAWKYIHMQPDEVWLAAEDLRAKALFHVHSSKFSLANHPWYEPLDKISNLSHKHTMPLVTPMIGEKVNLRDMDRTFCQWWKYGK
jgi:L-ascorbate metabolism protein UlaG (beta-lactamase superfamily)